METLWQDIKYGARVLLKKPGFTLVAVVALGLGIGANTAIFSVVNSVLLRPLPFAEPERLVMVWERRPRINRNEGAVAPADFLDWQSQSQSFEHMAAYSGAAFNLTGAGEPEQLTGQLVTPAFFSALGVAAQAGRTLAPETDVAGGPRVAVISHGLWQRRFGGDPGVVGRELRLNDEPFTVVGVAPQEFAFPNRATEIWATPRGRVPAVELPGSPDPAGLRSLHYLNVIARLKPDVSVAEAHTEMEAVAARLEQQYPEVNTGHTARVVSLHEQLVGDVRPALYVLLAAVGFVLLIACANVANLMLARASARHREIAIRTALGAGRLRLVRQLLTESVLLSLAGGGLGLLLALWGVDVLKALGPENLPRLAEVGPDARVVAFTLGVSVLTGILFGLAPALQASRLDLHDSLKEGGRGGSDGAGRRRTRGALVVTEVALAVLLLVGAGLLLKSFWRLQKVDPGFNPDRVLTMELSLPRVRYGEPQRMAAFFTQVLERVRAIPGVESAGATWTLPLTGQDAGRGFEVEGREANPNERMNAGFGSVSPGYFRTMGVPVLKGRDIDERDTASAPGVIVINETFARRHFAGEEPVGRRMRLRGEEPWLTVVGVVGDVKHTELAAEPRGDMYLSYQQTPFPFMSVVMRTAAEPADLTSALRAEVWAVDPSQPVAEVGVMRRFVENSVAAERFNALLVGAFAAVALALAAVGLYGVLAYTVAQRTREIGIRMALGAQRGDVLRMVVGQGMKMVLLGVVAGLAAGYGLTRLMSSLLYGVSATDPLTFVAVSALFVAVALLACYLPARRATKVDPMVALRYE